MSISSQELRQLYTQANHLEANSDKIILMTIDTDESVFYFHTDNEITISIPVGYQLISERFFKHTPPTPDDIEFAINYIEDEIERIIPKIPQDVVLYNANSFIKHIASLCGAETDAVMILMRDQLEYLFGQYAEISMGRPARASETDTTPLFYAQLLIFREFMHHMKFPSVKIIHSGTMEILENDG